jgi:selenocysteine lyase/cysteine desulfurase
MLSKETSQLMDIEDIRKKYSATKDCVYMNFGAGGCLADSVVGRISEVLNLENRLGSYHPDITHKRDKLFQDVRGRIAGLLNADESEIALTDNSTEGINIISRCFDWQPGDEVIISDAEHPGGYLPWINLANIRGIKVNIAPLKFDDEKFLASIKSLISQRTKVICLSHVAWGTGYRIPVKQVAFLARAKGVHFIVDGAQSVGQIPVDVKELGCDSYTVSGHKWLMGSMGAGALYVDKEWIKKLHYAGAGPFSAISYSLDKFEFVHHEGSRRFEKSTRSYALYSGLDEAIDIATKVGLDNIETRITDLATRLQNKLSEIPGLTLRSPWRPGGGRLANSGLVAYRIPGLPEDTIIEKLFTEHRIIGRKVSQPLGCRFSIHYINTEEEIEKAAAALEVICKAA